MYSILDKYKIIFTIQIIKWEVQPLITNNSDKDNNWKMNVDLRYSNLLHTNLDITYAVSYTHLDVYKRQIKDSVNILF